LGSIYVSERLLENEPARKTTFNNAERRLLPSINRWTTSLHATCFRASIELALTGPGAICLWRLCQIAEMLDVSLDWLTARSNVMDMLEMPEFDSKPPAPSAGKRKPKGGG
jgi:hypothetical protein